LRYLIVSDIHSNWEALEAVLRAARGKYDRVLCCGDLVGYGPDPNRVTDWARANLAAVVRGNHDRAAVGLDDLEWFNPVAKAAALWTHRELTLQNAAYIRALPKGPLNYEGFQVAHGSPLDEDEYLMDSIDAGQAFYYAALRLAFFGHTHVQGGFILQQGGIENLRRGPRVVTIDDHRLYLLNPGSVGQPRDGDPRAAYIVYDTQARSATFFRLDYDIAAVQEKIRRSGLPEVLADRLATGR